MSSSMRRHIRKAALTVATLAALATQLPTHAADFEVAPRFRDFYTHHQGIRVLGHPLSFELPVQSWPSQYFEKGRIEDHSRETTNTAWRFMYGRLTAEMMDKYPGAAVNNTNWTYRALRLQNPKMNAAPAFQNGVQIQPDGRVFIPYDAKLQAAPGYYVPANFWIYINRPDLFPGGWMHDVGLPLTDAVQATTVKNGETRTIVLQAFERTVLTYDPKNPQEWQVERGNIGADITTFPGGTK